MAFPSSLTEEEIELKAMFETLKRVKKLAKTVKIAPSTAVKGEMESEKTPKKRNLDEIAGATEEAKRLVKAGAMTISKVEEKQTFKRSKQLDRKLKEGDRDVGVKYQAFTPSFGSDYADETVPAPRQQRVPLLYDSFVGTGETTGGSYGGEARIQRGTTIYIRGYDLMEEPMRKAFADFGTIVRVHVEERRRSAFIDYSTNEEADRAIKEMNGNMLNGITLRVTMARRQNYVLRNGYGGGESSSRPESNRRPGPDWNNFASRRGDDGVSRDVGAGARARNEGGRDLVSYDDADDY